jgi:putative membrane protein
VAEIPIQRKEGRNIWPMLLGLLALLAVLWFLFGRNRNANTTAARADSTAVASNRVTTDSAAGTTANGMNGAGTAGAAGATGAMAGANAAGANAAGGTGAGGSNAALSDADVVNVMHEANAGEIATSEMARTKATNADVKTYARDMVVAHRAMDNKGAKLSVATATASNSALRDSITNANQAIGAQLKGASGAAFDKAYIDGQVTAHQNTLSFLQRAQSSAQNADLKQLITAAIPDVQKHLERAQSLQSKLNQ